MPNFFSGLSSGLQQGLARADRLRAQEQEAAFRERQLQESLAQNAIVNQRANRQLELNKEQSDIVNQRANRQLDLNEEQLNINRSAQEQTVANQKLIADMKKIELYNQERKMLFDQQKQAEQIKDKKYSNDIDQMNTILTNANNIGDPIARSTYLENIKLSKFYQNATPEAQEYLSAVPQLNENIQKNIIKLSNSIVSDLNKGDMENAQLQVIEATALTSNLSDNDPLRKMIVGLGDRVGLTKTPSSGSSMTVYDPETGNPLYTTSSGGKKPTSPEDLSSKSINNLQDSIIKNQNHIESLNMMEKALTDNPELLSLKARTEYAYKKNLQKINPEALTEKDKTFLDNYTSAVVDTMHSFNTFVKDMTGKAMSQAEVQRLYKEAPMFKGDFSIDSFLNDDSINTYMAKVKKGLKIAELANARSQYVLKNGLPRDSVSLDNMQKILDITNQKDTNEVDNEMSFFQNPNNKDIINKKGMELESKFKKENPNLSEEEIDSIVEKELSSFFMGK